MVTYIKEPSEESYLNRIRVMGQAVNNMRNEIGKLKEYGIDWSDYPEELTQVRLLLQHLSIDFERMRKKYE